MRYSPAFAFMVTILICGLCIQPVAALSADEWVNSGSQLVQQGQYQEALQAFENAINLDPGNIGAWAGKGYTLQNLNRLSESLDVFNKVLEIDSNNPVLWSGKSNLLNQMGRSAEALSAAEQALALDPSNANFWNSKGYACSLSGDTSYSLDAFNKALEIDSNNQWSWSGKSNVLNQMGRSTEALSAAEQALALDPTNANFWNGKGSALQNLNRLQESLDAYNQALSIDSGNLWSWNGKSNILFQMGRYAEALSAAEQALAIDSGNAGFWNIKGDALLSLGRYQESLDAYNMAIDSGNTGSWNGKINVFITMGRYAEAISAAEQALALDPTNANFWNGKGSALQSLNRLQESLDAYNQALSIDSGNPWAWSGKSIVLNQMGRYSEALTAADRALALDSGRADFWNSKGYALLSLGNYQGSLDAFNAGLACDATNQNSQNGRQEALIKIGTGPGSTISVTPVPTPLSVTADSTQKIQSMPPSSSHSGLADSITIFIPGTNDQGVIFSPTESGIYRFTIIGGSFSPQPTDDSASYWANSIHIFNNSPPRWIYYPKNDVWGPEDFDYYLGGGIMYPSSTAAATAGVGQIVDIPIDAGKYVNMICPDVQGQYSNNRGGITVSISKLTPPMAAFNAAKTTGTPIPTQLSVTAYPTSGIESIPSSSSSSNDEDSNLTSAVSTPRIESILRSFPLLNSAYSKLSLPIIIILTVVLLAGGSYTIYRIKKKSAGYQPPERKEKNAISPYPPSTGSTTKPELTISLDRTQLIADDWDKMTIQLVNSGNADAKNIRLTFSDEFDTKWIKPAMINAGASTSLDIGIRPKVKGKIPLEVTAIYHDVYSEEYRETHEFWIDVVEKGTTTSPPAETPSSPVGQFSPKPLTQKQLPPELSDYYTESEFIGKGGFSRVFKAKRKDGKYVAVKIPISMDAMTGRSFITELQNWTKLSHPNIVRLYDFNIMPVPFFEEELCDSALSDQEKPIECEEAAWILFNICEGLKFAHSRKIVHRDLKPQNILIKNGVPKISDWGLSRIISESTTTTSISFTPSYAAPEQINGRNKDERTDIWQLGVILYELITGILPFNGDSMVEVGMNIATKDPKHPGDIIPEAKVIDAIVMKCLEKDPNKRYQAVIELQNDLARYLRENYTELLKTSATAHDNTRSAFYCGDLVMINLLTGDIQNAYKYLLDLVHFSKGEVKVEAQELSEQIKMRIEMGLTEIPDELIQKTEFIVHQVSFGFRIKK